MIVNEPAVLGELQALAQRYETALMANDLEALDAMFWQSPQVVRLGVGENLYGIDMIREFRAQRPGASPPRNVLRCEIVAFGSDCGVVNVEFQRVAGGPVGRQSQTWVRFDDRWLIVSAHVSLMAGTH